MLVTVRLAPSRLGRCLAAALDLLQSQEQSAKVAFRARLLRKRLQPAGRRLRLMLSGSEKFLDLRRAAGPRCGILGAAAAGLVLCATTAADAPDVRPIFIVVSKPDPRVPRLEKFFEIYHCPAPRHTSEYLRTADRYGLDYRLLPAISIRETLCGVTAKQPNNHWGYHPGRQSFPSIEVGLKVLGQRLAQNPLYKGKTLQAKLFTYNPLPAYPDEIERIMRQIE